MELVGADVMLAVQLKKCGGRPGAGHGMPAAIGQAPALELASRARAASIAARVVADQSRNKSLATTTVNLEILK